MRIIHVCRTAVGGVGRHVADQIRGQKARGHEIGLICESADGGPVTEALLAKLQPFTSLGLKRMPIPALPSLTDWTNCKAIAEFAHGTRADLIHGHGSKGGVYARLAARWLGLPSAYTPHGGSLHYQWRSPAGAAFLSAEKVLQVRRSGLLFVCDYERRIYDTKVGLGRLPHRVVHNGLAPADFAVRHLATGAADFFFVGRMSAAKGVGTLLQALALIPAATRPTMAIVGDGPDLALNQSLAQRLGLNEKVQFLGEKPMREAMAHGRMMIVPSRHESFPYVVLEAVAAGIPILASDVGGIGEILPASQLIAPNQPEVLATKLLEAMADYPSLVKRAKQLRQDAKIRFSANHMVEATLSFYDALLADKIPNRRTAGLA